MDTSFLSQQEPDVGERTQVEKVRGKAFQKDITNFRQEKDGEDESMGILTSHEPTGML